MAFSERIRLYLTTIFGGSAVNPKNLLLLHTGLVDAGLFSVIWTMSSW